MDGPGMVVLFGSGETAVSAQRVYSELFGSLERPVRVGVLETPAGFELNSAWVAGRVGRYIEQHLQNFAPKVTIVPARKRGTPFSPDNPEVVSLLFSCNAFFMGAGSPTYAVRQLRDSLAWQVVSARHRVGAGLVFVSAAVLAVSAYTIPVYEIYKAGQDVHWQKGLDFFAPFGLRLVVVPHWNNSEGGATLDTSRCWMGLPRFAQLLEMLPDSSTIVGIDEHTGLVIDLHAEECRVIGRGGVTVLCDGRELNFGSGSSFQITELGDLRLPDPREGVPADVWEQAERAGSGSGAREVSGPSLEVLALVSERQSARLRRDWATADRIRDQLLGKGWVVRDTREGPELVPHEV